MADLLRDGRTRHTKRPLGRLHGSPNVDMSPDFLMGQAIYNAHKRVTWLSFWTVSGPLKGQPLTTSNYYSHGFAAGVWVATQIDTYRSLGVGIKPDWVIFDPEGYPDNHSGLDAPGGAIAGDPGQYATYWTAMLSGWSAGIDSVDPSLNAGVYASQSEYRNYQLSSPRCRSLSPSLLVAAVRCRSPGQPGPTCAASLRLTRRAPHLHTWPTKPQR